MCKAAIHGNGKRPYVQESREVYPYVHFDSLHGFRCKVYVIIQNSKVQKLILHWKLSSVTVTKPLAIIINECARQLFDCKASRWDDLLQQVWSEWGLGRRTEVSMVDGGLKTEAWDKRRRC